MNFKLLFLEKNWENWERKEIIEKFIKDFFPGWKLFEKLFSIKNLFHLTIANRFFSLNVNHKWSKLRDFFSSKKWLFLSEFYHYFYFIFFTEPWILFYSYLLKFEMISSFMSKSYSFNLHHLHLDYKFSTSTNFYLISRLIILGFSSSIFLLLFYFILIIIYKIYLQKYRC